MRLRGFLAALSQNPQLSCFAELGVRAETRDQMGAQSQNLAQGTQLGSSADRIGHHGSTHQRRTTHPSSPRLSWRVV